jgi:hypothetical protein
LLVGDEREAHIWRSQTLRLLRPPLRNDSGPIQDALRNRTNCQITTAVNFRVNSFLHGPARRIIRKEFDLDSKLGKQLIRIYQEAAEISYRLWTQRITLKCSTLQDLSVFDAENVSLAPHPLVHPDDHEDQLLGRPITVVVHPLLQAYGTVEADHYNIGRVLTPAIVWFDSKREG